MLVSLRPTKIAPGGSWGGQKYPENTIKKAIMAHVAPNGWISMDLGWIWAGYIQGGLLVPFGPTKIAPGRSWVVRNSLKVLINRGDSGHEQHWLFQMDGSQRILVGSGRDISRMVCWCDLDPPKSPPGGSGGSEIARIARSAWSMTFLGYFWTPRDNFGGSKWHQQATLDVSSPYPTQIHWDPAIWSHKGFLWHFRGISDPPGSPGGNFVGSKWHQQAILNVSCPDPTDIQLFGVTSAAYGQNGLFYGIKSIVPP